MSEMLPPIPEVIHLPTVFRRIRGGAIRIPAFQREFVWKESQVLDLLKSVYNGYPIGSILLWRVSTPILKAQSSGFAAFPSGDIIYPTLFVLDGMQRLSSLFGVFHYESNGLIDDIFNVIFDLRKKRFLNYDDGDLPEAFLELSAIFNPMKLINAQARIAQFSDGNDLINEIVKLHSVFQEYMIPTVTIETENLSSVVSIFERVNSTGLALSSVDFMRAVTWSEGFDLSESLRNLHTTFNELGFEFNDETLVKALGIVYDKAPTPDVLLTLRELSAGELNEGMATVSRTFVKLISFLKKEFEIHGDDYIPYEGQILVLFRVFVARDVLATNEIQIIAGWFWAVGFNESLRGKPDHYVSRAINSVSGLLAGRKTSLDARLNISSREFIERRFIKGKALSAAFSAMFAKNKARSLITGKVIPPENYMREFTSSHFQSIIPNDEIIKYHGTGAYNFRAFCNIAVASDAESSVISRTGLMRVVRNKLSIGGYHDVLLTQFITAEAADNLLESNFDRFFELRAEAMFSAAQSLVDYNLT